MEHKHVFEVPRGGSSLIRKSVLPETYNYVYRFLVNDQRDAQILFYVFISIYNSLHVLSTSCSSSGEKNCINTASGNSHFIIPDGCIVLVQFCFDVLVFLSLCCLFCIAKFYILLTVHHVMILGK